MPVGERVSKDSGGCGDEDCNFFENVGTLWHFLKKRSVRRYPLQKKVFILSVQLKQRWWFPKWTPDWTSSNARRWNWWRWAVSGLDVFRMEYSKVASVGIVILIIRWRSCEQYDLLLLPCCRTPSLVPATNYADLQSTYSHWWFYKDRQQLITGNVWGGVAIHRLHQRFNVNPQLARFTILKTDFNWCATPCCKEEEDLLLQIAEWFEQGQLLQVTKQ